MKQVCVCLMIEACEGEAPIYTVYELLGDAMDMASDLAGYAGFEKIDGVMKWMDPNCESSYIEVQVLPVN